MRKITAFFVLVTFIFSCIMPPNGYAQVMTAIDFMPKPGAMAGLSTSFTPAHLWGMTIHPNEPFRFDFLVQRGDVALLEAEKQAEYSKLIKYFLAALAVPDEDQWVNLSPYEKDRIIPDGFGRTEMGRDLLAQDYLLKQLTSSLIDPTSDLGKKFWDGVYAKAYEKFGSTDVPTETFNKVWIMPDKAVVFEKNNTVYVLESHLKVMTDKDYVAMKNNSAADALSQANAIADISSQMIREIIIPAIEKEVNEGKAFAPLRQVYSGMLLATWYKRTLKETILGQLYADKGKVKGVDQDPKANKDIYEQYVAAFKKGVVNMIRDDVDRYSKEVMPRKYFSGGTLGFVAIKDFAQGTPEDLKKVSTKNVSTTDIVEGKMVNNADTAMTIENARVAIAFLRTVDIKQIEKKLSAFETEGAELFVSLMNKIQTMSNLEEEQVLEELGLNGYTLEDLDLLQEHVKKIVEQRSDVTQGKIAIIGVGVFLLALGMAAHFGLDTTPGKISGVVALTIFLVSQLGGDPNETFDYAQKDSAAVNKDAISLQDTVEAIKTRYGAVSSTQDAEKMVNEGDFVKPVATKEEWRQKYDQFDEHPLVKRGLGYLSNMDVRDGLKVMASLPREQRLRVAAVEYMRWVNTFDAQERANVSLAVVEAPAEAELSVEEKVALDDLRFMAKFGAWHSWDTVRIIKAFYAAVASTEDLATGDIGAWKMPSMAPLSQLLAKAELVELQWLKEYAGSVLFRVGEEVAIMRSNREAIRKAYAKLGRGASGESVPMQLFFGMIGLEGNLEAVDHVMTILELGFYINGDRKNVRPQSEIDSFVQYVENFDAAMKATSGNKVEIQQLEEGKLKGGIDFAQSNLDLQIKRDGAGVLLPVGQQDLDNIKIDGLVPLILNIQPAAMAPIFREALTGV